MHWIMTMMKEWLRKESNEGVQEHIDYTTNDRKKEEKEWRNKLQCIEYSTNEEYIVIDFL